MSAASQAPAAPNGWKKEGFLTKQGHIVKNWKRRFFVLKAASLAYFAAVGDRAPKGVIPLAGAAVARAAVPRRAHCFSIMPGVRGAKQYVIACESAEDLDAWMICLARAAMSAAPSGPSTGRTMSTSSYVSEMSSMGSSTVGGGDAVAARAALTLFTGSWNLAEQSAPALGDWIPRGRDVYALGVQECMDPPAFHRRVLEVLGSGYIDIREQIGKTGFGYHGYIALFVYVREAAAALVECSAAIRTQLCMGKNLLVTRASNKGSVSITLPVHFPTDEGGVVDGAYVFVTCHIASDLNGKSRLSKRNANVREMLDHLGLSGIGEVDADTGARAASKPPRGRPPRSLGSKQRSRSAGPGRLSALLDEEDAAAAVATAAAAGGGSGGATPPRGVVKPTARDGSGAAATARDGGSGSGGGAARAAAAVDPGLAATAGAVADRHSKPAAAAEPLRRSASQSGRRSPGGAPAPPPDELDAASLGATEVAETPPSDARRAGSSSSSSSSSGDDDEGNEEDDNAPIVRPKARAKALRILAPGVAEHSSAADAGAHGAAAVVPGVPASRTAVFVMGDLNYRVDLPADQCLTEIVAAARGAAGGQPHAWDRLLAHDQLTKEMQRGAVLLGYEEARAVRFPPTYRRKKAVDAAISSYTDLNIVRNGYTTYVKTKRRKSSAGAVASAAEVNASAGAGGGGGGSEGARMREVRTPSYTDRIVFRRPVGTGFSTLRCESYGQVDTIKGSDHTPVYAEFVQPLAPMPVCPQVGGGGPEVEDAAAAAPTAAAAGGGAGATATGAAAAAAPPAASSSSSPQALPPGRDAVTPEASSTPVPPPRVSPLPRASLAPARAHSQSLQIPLPSAEDAAGGAATDGAADVRGDLSGGGNSSAAADTSDTDSDGTTDDEVNGDTVGPLLPPFRPERRNAAGAVPSFGAAQQRGALPPMSPLRSVVTVELSPPPPVVEPTASAAAAAAAAAAAVAAAGKPAAAARQPDVSKSASFSGPRMSAAAVGAIKARQHSEALLASWRMEATTGRSMGFAPTNAPGMTSPSIAALYTPLPPPPPPSPPPSPPPLPLDAGATTASGVAGGRAPSPSGTLTVDAAAAAMSAVGSSAAAADGNGTRACATAPGGVLGNGHHVVGDASAAGGAPRAHLEPATAASAQPEGQQAAVAAAVAAGNARPAAAAGAAKRRLTTTSRAPALPAPAESWGAGRVRRSASFSSVPAGTAQQPVIAISPLRLASPSRGAAGGASLSDAGAGGRGLGDGAPQPGGGTAGAVDDAVSGAEPSPPVAVGVASPAVVVAAVATGEGPVEGPLAAAAASSAPPGGDAEASGRLRSAPSAVNEEDGSGGEASARHGAAAPPSPERVAGGVGGGDGPASLSVGLPTGADGSGSGSGGGGGGTEPSVDIEAGRLRRASAVAGDGDAAEPHVAALAAGRLRRAPSVVHGDGAAVAGAPPSRVAPAAHAAPSEYSAALSRLRRAPKALPDDYRGGAAAPADAAASVESPAAAVPAVGAPSDDDAAAAAAGGAPRLRRAPSAVSRDDDGAAPNASAAGTIRAADATATPAAAAAPAPPVSAAPPVHVGTGHEAGGGCAPEPRPRASSADGAAGPDEADDAVTGTDVALTPLRAAAARVTTAPGARGPTGERKRSVTVSHAPPPLRQARAAASPLGASHLAPFSGGAAHERLPAAAGGGAPAAGVSVRVLAELWATRGIAGTPPAAAGAAAGAGKAGAQHSDGVAEAPARGKDEVPAHTTPVT